VPAELTPPLVAHNSSPDGEHTFPAATEEEVRRRAYQKWEAAGRPDGDGIQFWLEAEQELRGK
jgi:hypothetical protein